MPPLHRHQLAHLSAAGWQALLAQAWDADALACLQHWATHALPLVVTCQPAARLQPWAPLVPVVPVAPVAPVALGLAAPPAWPRRRLALQVLPAHIAWFDEFPTLAQALPLLARDSRAALKALQAALQGMEVRARVYGSAGWQQLTGLRYLHDHSDLDLWLGVADAQQADQVVGLLQACHTPMRMDGELLFPHGGAVAWREWAAWRAGRCRSMLVKRLHGAALEQAGDLPATAWPCAA
jgi:phosphoribosyl-dephospho-CoA transferase